MSSYFIFHVWAFKATSKACFLSENKTIGTNKNGEHTFTNDSINLNSQRKSKMAQVIRSLSIQEMERNDQKLGV